MNSYKTISDCLDIFVRQIAKASTLVPRTGLMKGKMGIAILLHNYARYRNDSEINDCANALIDMVIQEMNIEYLEDMDDGLCGVAWGFDCLIKENFIQTDENDLEEIDTFLFQEENRTLYLSNLAGKSDMGLYILNRLNSCNPIAKNKWRQRFENCINHFHDILMQRYTSYEFPVFPCRVLIRFFHTCQIFYEQEQYRFEIDTLYEELPETVKISLQEEPCFSDRYILCSMLAGIPVFEKCLPVDNTLQEITPADAGNFYLTRLILSKHIFIPEIVNETILSVAADQQRIDELLNQMNPNNAGLGNPIGGLAWAMLQRCMEKDKFSPPVLPV